MWGEHSIGFRLPTASLNIRGLSALQRDTLSRYYPEFVVRPGSTSTGVSRTSGQGNFECRAYRLSNAPQVTVEALTREGQYTPVKVRTLRSIELTGVNFRASIETYPRFGSSSLGVALEHELTQADVIENFLRVFSAHQALARSGLILHSAGVVFKGKAYIFVGRSGAGKTTLAGKAYGEGGLVLSDDLNLLLPRGDGYRAFVVPFAGEFGRTINKTSETASYPVAAIVLLEQGDQLRAGEISASRAAARLMVGSPFVNMDKDESAMLFDVVTDLIHSVPVITLQCAKGDPALDIISLVVKHVDDAQLPRPH